jgi:hypothetical protein
MNRTSISIGLVRQYRVTAHVDLIGNDPDEVFTEVEAALAEVDGGLEPEQRVARPLRDGSYLLTLIASGDDSSEDGRAGRLREVLEGFEVSTYLE